ncbi:MAG: hypothetical protein D0433_05565 [Candidatus Thermochlorobacter aerophilum]|jgi:hypothetical protein|uniref:Uncharacterized protein n=1 Tax=Candidatus Thermochlorobacter aerophilus TaxID=1868324 RepID=A0A395M0Z1_9BACT|nr:MAG: hypothetical protein D0433_05565 [Candidatus Thermochlorobacter aerophilum]
MLLSYAKVLALSVEIVSCCKIETYSKTMVRSKTGGFGVKILENDYEYGKVYEAMKFYYGEQRLAPPFVV